jgi:hypothetical protein
MENILFDTVTEKYHCKNINGTNIRVFKRWNENVFYINGDQ